MRDNHNFIPISHISHNAPTLAQQLHVEQVNNCRDIKNESINRNGESLCTSAILGGCNNESG